MTVIRLGYIVILFFLLLQFAHLAGEISSQQDRPTIREVCQEYVCSTPAK